MGIRYRYRQRKNRKKAYNKRKKARLRDLAEANKKK